MDLARYLESEIHKRMLVDPDLPSRVTFVSDSSGLIPKQTIDNGYGSCLKMSESEHFLKSVDYAAC